MIVPKRQYEFTLGTTHKGDLAVSYASVVINAG